MMVFPSLRSIICSFTIKSFTILKTMVSWLTCSNANGPFIKLIDLDIGLPQMVLSLGKRKCNAPTNSCRYMDFLVLSIITGAHTSWLCFPVNLASLPFFWWTSWIQLLSRWKPLWFVTAFLLVEITTNTFTYKLMLQTIIWVSILQKLIGV